MTDTNLQEALKEALGAAAHWKANHDNQVQKARVLFERVDVPIERLKIFEKYTEAVNSAEIYRKLGQRYLKLSAMSLTDITELWKKCATEEELGTQLDAIPFNITG